MPRTIHFRVEGESEKFFEEMKKMGLNERDVFAKALGLLNLVHKTGRVALLRPNAASTGRANEVVDFVFTLQELESAKSDEPTDVSGGPTTTLPYTSDSSPTETPTA